MADYTTKEAVKAELVAGQSGVDFPADWDAELGNMVTAASRLIDDYKRVEDGAYAADTQGSEVRYFFGCGCRRQSIDYATAITAVEVEETDGTYTAWASTDYFTWPYNISQTGEPIQALEVNGKSDGSKSVFTRGQQRVKVTGTWGISGTTPANIARACRIQTARWYQRAAQGWADSGANPELGQLLYVKELDPDVKLILDRAFPHLGGGGI